MRYLKVIAILAIFVARGSFSMLEGCAAPLNDLTASDNSLTISRQLYLIAAWVYRNEDARASENEYINSFKTVHQFAIDIQKYKAKDLENLGRIDQVAEHVKQLVIATSGKNQAVRSKVLEITESEGEVDDPFHRAWLLEIADDLRYWTGYFGKLTGFLLDRPVTTSSRGNWLSVPRLLSSQRQFEAFQRKLDSKSVQKNRKQLESAIAADHRMIMELNYFSERQVQLERLKHQPIRLLNENQFLRLDILQVDEETHRALNYDFDERYRLLRKMIIQRGSITDAKLHLLQETHHDPFNVYKGDDVELESSSSAKQLVKNLQDHDKWRGQW